MRSTRFAMCPPTHFGVEYSINPWMDPSCTVDTARANAEWLALKQAIEAAGAEVEVVDPVPGLPDMVFIADAAAVVGRRALLASFRHPERRGEEPHVAAWLEARGYEVERVPDGVYFEGLGDLEIEGDRAIFSYGPRTCVRAREAIERCFPQLDICAEVELVNPWYYHIGLAVLALDEHTVLVCAEALSQDGLDVIRALGLRCIIAEPDDVANLVVNSVVVGRTIVTHACSRELAQVLGDLGFEVVTCPVSEFKKAGGGPRCLVLPLPEHPQ